MMKNEKEFYQMLGELKRQDIELHRLFAERQEIRKKCEELGGMPLVNTMWEVLFSDGESHYSF